MYLLLLQKKEEAEINNAVIKPSIKIIDKARTDIDKITPNPKLVVILIISSSFVLVFITIFLYNYFENKIYNRDELYKIIRS